MNIFLNFINVKNNNIISLIISRRYRIDLIMKFELKKIYSIDFKNHFLIAKVFVKNELILTKFTNLTNLKFNIEKITINSTLKTQLFNEITIYEK